LDRRRGVDPKPILKWWGGSRASAPARNLTSDERNACYSSIKVEENEENVKGKTDRSNKVYEYQRKNSKMLLYANYVNSSSVE
jgi:hypothetical protein